MGRIISAALLFTLTLILTGGAHAHGEFYADESGENMWMGVKSYNSQTREYVFGCVVPPGSGSVESYYWTVRPDVPENEHQVSTPSDELRYTLGKDVLYHVGCQAHNGSTLLRGDFHIDLRAGPNTDRPNVVMDSGNGLTGTFTCTPPQGVSDYTLKWTILGIKGQYGLPQFENQRTITHTFSEPLIWDIDCSVYDRQTNTNTQWGLPVEFYASGAPYVANANGCLPTGYCPPDTAATQPPTCTPSTEVCDQRDNDCDGQVDEGLACTPPPADTCHESVRDIPATCAGGSVTEDSWSGSCRTLRCSAAGSSMQVLACDKGSYFEMYKQSKVGTAVSEICIGETCISSSGFARSDSFPICADPTPSPDQPPAEACYNSVKDIPVTCTGTVTADSWNGCRTVLCSSGSGSGSIRTLACDKSGHFEVYKQSQSGSVPQVCFGSTCIGSSAGFAKSGSFPVCLPASTNQPPQPPTWLEPSAGKTDVDPYDFHIHAHGLVDAEGDAHVSSDFELWDAQSNERVWHSTSTPILYHIHNGDGTFVGSLAGSDRLEYDTEYRLRARFRTADGQVSAWSEWRTFRTRQQVAAGNAQWTVRDGYHLELVADGISVPVNIALAPDSYTHLAAAQRPLLYVTNLYGQITVVREDGSTATYADGLLNYETFGSLPGSGENGVIGLYVDPSSGDLFVSLTYEQDGAMFGKVERFITDDEGDSYTARRVILSGIPTSPAHQPQQITRGPDGKLYLSTGDADDPGSVQDPSSLVGKILRFNDDGSIPADNPWPGTYTWAMGFRNAFGTDWRPGTSELFISHNGPDHNDGVYRVTRGFVGGWKTSGDTSAGTWHLWPQTVAPTALAIDKGTAGFPASTTGNAFVALSGATYSEGPSMNAKRIVELDIAGSGSNGGQTDLVRYTGSGYSAPIGLAFGDDGLYFTDMYGEAGFVGYGVTHGRIYRIAPGSGDGDDGSSTAFSAGIAPARWYPQGVNVVWECKGVGGSGNYMYDYVFGDGQKQLGTTSASVYHSYPGSGTYIASCTVHDLTARASVSASTTITV